MNARMHACGCINCALASPFPSHNSRNNSKEMTYSIDKGTDVLYMTFY